MKIQMTLNDKKIVLDADPSESLKTVLRKQKLYSVKCGCEEGHCGACMVLLNGIPVSSCIIPVGTIRDKEVITLEYLKSTPLYSDIMSGFSMAKVHLCGYCNAGKIFTAYSVLKRFHRPEREQVISAIKGLDPCCTDQDSFANSIIYAVAVKHQREGRQNNGKK